MSKFDEMANRLSEVMFGRVMERATEVAVYCIGGLLAVYILVVLAIAIL